jgi:poly(3-hydroxybutyrate) depolymerase
VPVRRLALLAVAVLLLGGSAAQASLSEKVGTFNGVTVHYKIVLPKGYDAAREYPVIVAFPPGGQDMGLVDNRLQANWRAEAEHRGYIVISPAAPDGQLFFEQGSRVFPQFIEQIVKDFKVRDGKLIVAGASNGGLSAFFVASHYPKYVRVLVGYPGLLPESSAKYVEALKGMCVFMHVGGEDAGWRGEMQAQSQLLHRDGVNVAFTVEPGQQHMIQTLSGDGAKRLFDEIESCH